MLSSASHLSLSAVEVHQQVGVSYYAPTLHIREIRQLRIQLIFLLTFAFCLAKTHFQCVLAYLPPA
jgi:hypothetical protein